MSVSTFSMDELATIYTEYGSIRQDLVCDAPSTEDMACALQAAHFANIAAYNMQYGSRHDLAQMENVSAALDAAPLLLARNAPDRAGRQALIKQLHLVGYNAITNAGTDFLPSNYRSILDYAARCITENLAGINR